MRNCTNATLQDCIEHQQIINSGGYKADSHDGEFAIYKHYNPDVVHVCTPESIAKELADPNFVDTKVHKATEYLIPPPPKNS